MKNKILAFLTVFTLIFILSGCSANQNGGTPNSTPAPTSDGNSVMQSDTNNTADITVEQAEKAALDHAGVKKDDATFKRTELERDDGVYKYEIEFYVGTTEYDYEINAKTGEVISFDRDID